MNSQPNCDSEKNLIGFRAVEALARDERKARRQLSALRREPTLIDEIGANLRRNFATLVRTFILQQA